MRRSGVLAAVVITVLALAGCGAAQTGSASLARSGLDSIDGQIGSLRLLSVSVASPGTRGSRHIAGDSAALLLTVANDGESDDVLTGARTDVATDVVLRDGDHPSRSSVQVTVPAGGVAVLREVSGPHLELARLHEVLRAGLSVPVTFDFRDAGPLTLDVPVRTYTDVRPDRVSAT